jgi:tetratricopeptide (TPR) repeat protein
MGKHEEAFERLEEAHDILKKNEGPDSEKAAMLQSEMGILHKKLGQFDKVLKALQQAHRIDYKSQHASNNTVYEPRPPFPSLFLNHSFPPRIGTSLASPYPSPKMGMSRPGPASCIIKVLSYLLFLQYMYATSHTKSCTITKLI